MYIVDRIDSFLLDAIENSIKIHGMVWEAIFWSSGDQIFSLRFHQMTCDPLGDWFTVLLRKILCKLQCNFSFNVFVHKP